MEVKGCWHKELNTAMDTQLSMRYLKDHESHYGIYLAVWFLRDEWDGREDWRKRNTPQYSLARADSSFSGGSSKNRQRKSTVNGQSICPRCHDRRFRTKARSLLKKNETLREIEG